MNVLDFDYKNVLSFIDDEEINSMKEACIIAKEKLVNKTGLGNDYIGWVDWPVKISREEVNSIKNVAGELRSKYELLIVIGIGGSYLGAKAALSMLDSYFYNSDKMEVLFVGNTLSSSYTYELLEYAKNKNFCVNVISKSGTTTEPAIAFRMFRELLETKYGNDAKNRIVATTTNHDSVLHSLALTEGYKEFFIPDSIGGRYSVLTAVGLLPIACRGYDIDSLLNGAKDSYNHFLGSEFNNNEAMKYASIRNLLYKKGKLVEILVAHEPKMSYFSEWWKQLFGESEGKDLKGIYPSSVVYSTDLHSLGQFVQDGNRLMFETVINIVNPKNDIIIKEEKENLDKLNFLAGKGLDYVSKQAMKGTILAHVSGSVPNMLLNVSEINEYVFGYIVYFFMFACGISGYLLDVNPFNQEGVEAYKKKMFALLGKPGY